MNVLRMTRFWLVLAFSLFLASCSTQYTTNPNLPVIDNVKTLSDVSMVAFEWDLSPAVEFDGYVINRTSADDKDAKAKEIKKIHNPRVTHAFDDELDPTTSYVYTISTFKGEQISKPSKPLRISTSFIDPVEQVFVSNAYPKTIKLFWTPHPNPSVESYIIERKFNTTFRAIDHIKNRFNIEYFDTNLDDGVEYQYRIIAVDFNNNKSKPSKIATSSTIKKPSALQGLKISQDRVREIVLSWDMPTQSDINMFRIYHSSNNIFFDKIADVKENSYIHKNLKDGEIGYYKIVALKENDLEGLSDQVLKGATLSLPLSPLITSSEISNGRATIKWQSGKDSRSEKYIVYRQVGFSQALRFNEINALSFTDKEMKPGVVYKYSVSGVDKHGMVSPPSQILELKVD